MSSRRLSFTEKRRASLAKSVAHLDKLETRNTITEPISVLGLSLSAFRGLAQDRPDGSECGQKWPERTVPPAEAAIRSLARQVYRAPTTSSRSRSPSDRFNRRLGRRRAGPPQNGSAPAARAKAQSTDWPAAVAPAAAPSPTQSGISAPWHPAKGPGGGAALPPRGGSGGPAARPASRHAAAPPSLPASTPAASNAGAAAALLAAVAGTGDNAASPPPRIQARSPVHGSPGRPTSRSRLVRFDRGRPRIELVLPRRLPLELGRRGRSRAPRLDPRPNCQQRLGSKPVILPVFPSLRP